jgi:hypothetical protein
MMPSQSAPPDDVLVRPMLEGDLVGVRRILRVAFGTFIGVPNPEDFWADREYVFTRWRTDPAAALVAEVDGGLAGSNFATKWGSFAFFGPLTVRPDLWDKHIAQKLLARTMDMFAKWGVKEAGLFTFAQSAKHIALYQKFGFWPRFLTAIMSKLAVARKTEAVKLSSLRDGDQDFAIRATHELTGTLYDGLDVTSEIKAVRDQKLGETLLLWDGDSLEAFAVCHCREGSEVGKDTCYVKFAAVKPGANAESAFECLLDGCESVSAERGLGRLEAGVNLDRRKAYRQMLQRGFRTEIQGVAMHRPDTPAFNRSDTFVIDDWR